MRHTIAVAFTIAGIACTARLASSADVSKAVTFTLTKATIADAATVLRSIAGVGGIEAAGEHAFTVRDTPDKLELSAALVKMLNADGTGAGTSLSAADGTVIAAVVLERASAGDVLRALRDELHFARSATAGEKRIFLRDTDRQLQAARKVIERLERGSGNP